MAAVVKMLAAMLPDGEGEGEGKGKGDGGEVVEVGMGTVGEDGEEEEEGDEHGPGEGGGGWSEERGECCIGDDSHAVGVDMGALAGSGKGGSVERALERVGGNMSDNGSSPVGPEAVAVEVDEAGRSGEHGRGAHMGATSSSLSPSLMLSSMIPVPLSGSVAGYGPDSVIDSDASGFVAAGEQGRLLGSDPHTSVNVPAGYLLQQLDISGLM